MRDEQRKKEIRKTRRLLNKLTTKAQMTQETGEITAMIDAIDDELYYQIWNFKF